MSLEQEFEELMRGMDYEQLLKFALKLGMRGRRFYQEQKDLVERLTIRTDEQTKAWRIDVRQDNATRGLIGRLQIEHRGDDILWDEFMNDPDYMK